MLANMLNLYEISQAARLTVIWITHLGMQEHVGTED